MTRGSRLLDRRGAERIAMIAAYVIRAYADQARLIDAPDPPREALPLDQFTANLLDLLDGMITADATMPSKASRP